PAAEDRLPARERLLGHEVEAPRQLEPPPQRGPAREPADHQIGERQGPPGQPLGAAEESELHSHLALAWDHLDVVDEFAAGALAVRGRAVHRRLLDHAHGLLGQLDGRARQQRQGQARRFHARFDRAGAAGRSNNQWASTSAGTTSRSPSISTSTAATSSSGRLTAIWRAPGSGPAGLRKRRRSMGTTRVPPLARVMRAWRCAVAAPPSTRAPGTTPHSPLLPGAWNPCSERACWNGMVEG